MVVFLLKYTFISVSLIPTIIKHLHTFGSMARLAYCHCAILLVRCPRIEAQTRKLLFLTQPLGSKDCDAVHLPVFSANPPRTITHAKLHSLGLPNKNPAFCEAPTQIKSRLLCLLRTNTLRSFLRQCKYCPDFSLAWFLCFTIRRRTTLDNYWMWPAIS